MSTVTDIATQFRARMLSNNFALSKNGYINSIKNTSVVSFWDSIVAKLDSLLSYVTNGSWSVSEKTALIHKMDAFKKKLIDELNGTGFANMPSTIDRKIFYFMMETISEKSLLPDINLSLTLGESGEHFIQLKCAGGVLAEYHGNFNGALYLQNYNLDDAKYMPPELSQRLCSFMSLWEQFYLWSKLNNQLCLDLNRNANEAANHSLTILLEKQDKYILDCLKGALCNLQDYLRESGYNYNTFISINFTGDPKITSDLWFSIARWVDAAKINDTTFKLPESVKNNIYTLFGF